MDDEEEWFGRCLMVLISDSRFKAQAAAAIIRDSCKSPVLNPSVSPVHVFTRGKVSKCAGLRTLRNINLVSVQECSIREPLNLFLCSLSCPELHLSKSDTFKCFCQTIV